jgi:hypothetical protein
LWKEAIMTPPAQQQQQQPPLPSPRDRQDWKDAPVTEPRQVAETTQKESTQPQHSQLGPLDGYSLDTLNDLVT